MFPNSPQTALEKWKELGHIDIEEYLNKSLAFLEFDPESIEFKEIESVNDKNSTMKISGYFQKGTNKIMGLCRVVFSHGEIQEGIFFNSDFNGYARVIYESGDYYVGHLRNYVNNGYGLYKSTNGAEYLGEWKND